MPKYNLRPKANSRAAVADIIDRWLRTGHYPERLIPEDTPDRAFVMEAVYGVTRWKGMLEWVASKLASREPKGPTVPYLLTGLYQILLMDDVPEYASVSETVKAAGKKLGQARAGFVNALLRRALREKEQLLEAIAAQPLAIRQSHPELIVQRWTDRIGAAGAEALCEWNNLRPSVCVRVNTMRTTFTELLERFHHSSIDAAPHPADPESFLVIPGGIPVPKLPGFADGLFAVQDPSTARAVGALNAQPGQRVLDACAAPGGKALAIAEAMRNTGKLVAMDLHEDRLAPLRENIERMGATCVSVVRGDIRRNAALVAAGEGGHFDRVLLDVPCSNTGAFRRRPSARWRFSLKRLDALLTTQRALLDNAPHLLAPDGILVYSTCSMEPEENEDMVASWLEEHRDFELITEVRATPPESRTDGAYTAALRKNRNFDP